MQTIGRVCGLTPDTTRLWPDNYEGAVSLTFDDALPSQLKKAIPMMDERGLRGTFYVSLRGEDWRKAMEPWRAVHDAGHEIGNHSLSHTCSLGFQDDPGGHGLERMTLADIEADVMAAEGRLAELFPRESRSYCYPCYQTHVGEGLDRQSYVPVIAKHFVAGRGIGEVPNHSLTCDLHCLWSWDVSRMTGANLVGLAEQCASRGRWGLLVFHGIDSGHLPVSSVDFVELCAHLERHSNRIWTAPVAEVADWVRELRRDQK